MTMKENKLLKEDKQLKVEMNRLQEFIKKFAKETYYKKKTYRT